MNNKTLTLKKIHYSNYLFNQIYSVIKERININGRIKTAEVMTMVYAAGIISSKSAISGVFKYIMESYTDNGYAEYLRNGQWMIIVNGTTIHVEYEEVEKKSCGRKPRIKVKTEINYNHNFLYPPKEHPEVEIYQALKQLNDKSKFFSEAMRLCEENKISIHTLINYINEQGKSKQQRRADNIQSV